MKHRILFGLIYSLIYWFLALFNIGPEGKGTTMFFAPLLPWFLLFIALFLLNKLDALRNRIFFVGIMVLHYGLTLLFLYAALTGTYKGKSGLVRALEQPELMLFTIGWYLLGQAFICLAFFKEIKKQGNEEEFL